MTIDSARPSRAEDKTIRRARNRIQWRIRELTRAYEALREEVARRVGLGEGVESLDTEALDAIRIDLVQLIAALRDTPRTARVVT